MLPFEVCRLSDLALDFEKYTPVWKLRRKYSLRNRSLLKQLIEAWRLGLASEDTFARLLLDKTQYDFPSEPEARFAATLGCMSTELKLAVLLELESSPKTYIEIAKRLAADTSVKLPTPSSFFDYCADILASAGFVVQYRLGRGFRLVRRHFGLSVAGERYGRPIAAFSLRYAVDHNISLYNMLGQGKSPGNSMSPYNRVRIVELVDQGLNRIVDLTRRLDLSIEDVRQHLNKLTRLGVLTFTSLSFDKSGVKTYAWVDGRLPGEVMPIRGHKKLTREIAQWLYVNKIGERNRIARELGYAHVTNISGVLVGLCRQGLAYTSFGSCDKSRVTLAKGSRLVMDYTRAVRNALEDKEELNDMRAVFQEFIRDRDMFRRYLDAGIEIYAAASPNLNAKTPSQRETELLHFIEAYQGAGGMGPRPVDIVKGLDWTHGTVIRYLRLLGEKGLLLHEKKGAAARYSVSPA